MLTVRVRRALHHAFCQGVLLGCQGVPLDCFSRFLLAFCAFLFTFCFRLLSLSFLPLSPIAYLLSPLSVIFSPRVCRCVVSSVFAYFHEYSCLANVLQAASTPPMIGYDKILAEICNKVFNSLAEKRIYQFYAIYSPFSMLLPL